MHAVVTLSFPGRGKQVRIRVCEAIAPEFLQKNALLRCRACDCCIDEWKSNKNLKNTEHLLFQKAGNWTFNPAKKIES